MNSIMIIFLVASLTFLFIFASLVFLRGIPITPAGIQSQLNSIFQDIGLNLYFAWFNLKLKFDALFGQQKFRALKFRAWIENELIHQENLQTWLLSLSDSAFQAITDGAARHCKDLNISIDWLFGQDLKVAPDVGATIKLIIIEYLDGCFTAVHGQESIALFSLYEQLIDPNRLRQKIDLRRTIFKKIISLGLVEPIPAYDLIMSSELQRQKIAAAALRDAAKKDWAQFAQALSSILLTTEDQQTT
ncbi:MAG: hypothetical protein VKO39_10655 [Cyanobacteriota bacterium]|nr:hypothetical protein [Cyanobacteriota bacterium]